MFSSSSNIDSYASGKEVVSVKLPTISSTEDAQAEHSGVLVNASQPKDAPAITPAVPTQEKQIPDLVTLSLLPKSQWQSLINLDIIKVFYHSDNSFSYCELLFEPYILPFLFLFLFSVMLLNDISLFCLLNDEF